MTLADERLKELDSPSLTEDERAVLRCRVAADLIHAGQYEAAREALGEFWRGVGARPNVEGMGEATAAEVLLQVGFLSGWMGASSQAAGAQESAKDLISESAAIFERLGDFNRAAAVRSDLALCYWREGAYDEARVLLEEASALISGDGQLKAKTVLRLVVVEASAGRYSDALRLLTESAPTFGEGAGHVLQGGFHNELGNVYQLLGKAERREDYTDKAILEYTAAIYHYGQAGHGAYCASIENNLAFLLYKLERHRQAHEHLDRAGAALRRLNDAGLLAQVDETRARVFLAEKKYREAGRVISRAVQTLEHGGAAALLAEGLTTQGVTLARLGDNESSINSLRRAVRVAGEAGALSNAGLAALTLIEEHGARRVIPAKELYQLYRRADELLKDTQDAEDIARLRAAARIVMRRLADVNLHDKNFTFYNAVQEFEAKLIEQALDEAGGSVTRAAKLLGLTHQTLGTMLSQRHKKLAEKRAPREKRLRSIIKEPKE
ncbi:MAG TPA: helix-turn-helix domain-containing protein [Pyrinomonadaceae bacterium]|nr:helix-turn-helix domain-containing protein [Pyrinomonadaceae bacterium]